MWTTTKPDWIYCTQRDGNVLLNLEEMRRGEVEVPDVPWVLCTVSLFVLLQVQ